jgi:hypothetical protein
MEININLNIVLHFDSRKKEELTEQLISIE